MNKYANYWFHELLKLNLKDAHDTSENINSVFNNQIQHECKGDMNKMLFIVVRLFAKCLSWQLQMHLRPGTTTIQRDLKYQGSKSSGS